MIDPGPGRPGHVAAVRALADRRGGIAGILLTHSHPDHTAGVPLLDAAVVEVTGDRAGPFERPGDPRARRRPRLPAARAGLLQRRPVLGHGLELSSPRTAARWRLPRARCAKLRERDLELLCPGHGPCDHDPAAKIASTSSTGSSVSASCSPRSTAGERSRERLLAAAWDDVPPGLRPAAAVVMAGPPREARGRGSPWTGSSWSSESRAALEFPGCSDGQRVEGARPRRGGARRREWPASGGRSFAGPLPRTAGTVRVRWPLRPGRDPPRPLGRAPRQRRAGDDAWFGQGFCHGQDRLWQLDLYRRFACGRLAEIAGDDGPRRRPLRAHARACAGSRCARRRRSRSELRIGARRLQRRRQRRGRGGCRAPGRVPAPAHRIRALAAGRHADR